MLRDDLRFFYKGIVLSGYTCLKRVFSFKKKDYTSDTILVAGGYGWGNAGDEAQCTTTLKMLRKRYKDLQIVCLTPNIRYSYPHNRDFYCRYASRVMVFNQGRATDLFSYIEKSRFKTFCFFVKFIVTYLNCYLVRAELPVFLINSKTASFLYELKEARLLFFCGGGYLTGSTISRLWDGILMCACARVLRTDVVMSGQTIGNFNTRFNKALARWGFSHVRLITTRDREISLADLKEIGLSDPKRYFATCDDAVFCEKKARFKYSDHPYAVVNFMDFMMPDRDRLSEYLVEICNDLKKRFEGVVFLPMDNLDIAYYKDLKDKFGLDCVDLFSDKPADFKTARALIASSSICFTMRHHPIVFALGEAVPVVSLYCNDYFEHKNIGALSLFGLDEFSLDLRKEDFVQSSERLIDKALSSKDAIKTRIKVTLEELSKKKEVFMRGVDRILEDQQ